MSYETNNFTVSCENLYRNTFDCHKKTIVYSRLTLSFSPRLFNRLLLQMWQVGDKSVLRFQLKCNVSFVKRPQEIQNQSQKRTRVLFSLTLQRYIKHIMVSYSTDWGSFPSVFQPHGQKVAAFFQRGRQCSVACRAWSQLNGLRR